MSDYYRDQGYHSRKRLLRRVRYVFWFILAGLLVAGAFLAWDIYRQSKEGDSASKLSTPINSTIVADSNVQTSTYFQFQASSKWRAIANETREGHYVYRQYNGALVEQSLVIDVNSQSPEPLALTATTHILPVTVTTSGTLVVQGDVSEHCKKFVVPPTSQNPQIVTYNKISFACSPDGRRTVARVGLIGGSEDMRLPRPNGTSATYTITYENLTAIASFRDMQNIIETFETR